MLKLDMPSVSPTMASVILAYLHVTMEGLQPVIGHFALSFDVPTDATVFKDLR